MNLSFFCYEFLFKHSFSCVCILSMQQLNVVPCMLSRELTELFLVQGT